MPMSGLCLSCGAPFIPIGEDMVEYDRLGNISIFYLQKLTRTNPMMQATIRTPTFCSGPQSAHILHKTHHYQAVHFIAEDKHENPRGDDYFPFIRAPTGKSPKRLLATWDPIPDDLLIKFPGLQSLIGGLRKVGNQPSDYKQEVQCCKDCNSTMTMEFWFRYHLYSGSNTNEGRIIPDEAITVYKVTCPRNAQKIEDSGQWKVNDVARDVEGTYPEATYRKTRDIMSAAVAYYLDMCAPRAGHALLQDINVENHKLYIHMCWVVMQTTCLLCEYVRGSRDMVQHERAGIKRNQCHKSPLGAAELYFSYFCWRILGFRFPGVCHMSFPDWHRFYMWDAGRCEELFPRDQADATGRLIADKIAPQNMYAPSRTLVQQVAHNMTATLKNNIWRLGEHLSGERKPELTRYFVPRRNLRALTRLIERGVSPDFDSYAVNVGIDALFSRVIDMGRDFDSTVRKRLLAFRTAWRRAEMQNVARNSGIPGATPATASVPYTLCKLLDPPSLEDWAAMSAPEAQEVLDGPQCSPWACVLALEQLGAFDPGDDPDAD